MKINSFLRLLLVITIVISVFLGRSSDSNLRINDLFSKVEVADMEIVDVNAEQFAKTADGLRYWAYDAIFALSLATMEAGDNDKGISLVEDGDTKIYTFDSVKYIIDFPDATVSGVMKATRSEDSDKADISLAFLGDPQGLESITIQSTGAHGTAHGEGALTINGEESNFEQFVAYFGARVSHEL